MEPSVFKEREKAEKKVSVAQQLMDHCCAEMNAKEILERVQRRMMHVGVYICIIAQFVLIFL